MKAATTEATNATTKAATKLAAAASVAARLPGDGLVPVMSALGQHKDAGLTLPVPASRQAIFYDLNHFDLLSSRAVSQRLQSWLA